VLDEGLLVVGPDNRVACVNGYLRHILGIDRKEFSGAEADEFIRRNLVPRIAEEPCRAAIMESLSGRSPAADVLCTLRSPDGGENRVRWSCRVVDEGLFRGVRVIRLLSEPAAPREAPLLGTSGWRGIDDILRQNEGWYRFLIENLNEGIGLIDREGALVFANQRLADITGCPVAELVGLPATLFVDERGAGCLGEYLQNPDKSSHEVYEVDLIQRAGARVHTLITTAPIIDAGGTCRGFLAGIQDVTLLKQMEMKLRESEEKYRSLVELSAEAILIHRGGRIAYINPACMRLLGASHAGEIIGKAVLDVVHPEARDAVRSFGLRNLRGEVTPLVELLVVRLDGRTVPVEGRGTRMLFEGRPAVQVVMRDVTHQKQVKERLEARNRHLLLLNRIIGTSASARTPAELMETALSQTIDLLGYDCGAIYHLDAVNRGETALQYQQNMPDACLKRAESIFAESCAGSLAAGLPHYLEHDRHRSTSTSRLLRELGLAALACIPLIVESDAVGALLIGSLDRETFSSEERGLLEAVSREIGAGILRGMLYQRLETANQEANLYLDILTHDIRNADNIASIYADLLIDELDGEPARHARKLKGGIKKSIEITANVATIRKIHENQAGLAPCDLDKIVRDEIAHYPDLCIHYTGLSVQVLGDDLLPEVFTNLLGNTVKHGGPGVEVTVTVEDRDEETVVVTIADSGPGVPDDMKETIFFRFEREGGRRGSQGLGLSICRLLTARYGGRIWAEDRVPGRPEEGAAFRFTLLKAREGRNA
jgi:PAS domain S-box-containing protein